jgi:hypothetical protein
VTRYEAGAHSTASTSPQSLAFQGESVRVIQGEDGALPSLPPRNQAIVAIQVCNICLHELYCRSGVQRAFMQDLTRPLAFCMRTNR